eukprot:gene13498-3942_t
MAAGIIVEHVVRTANPDDGKEPAQRLEALQKKFPCCADVKGDLANILKFWQV